MLDPWEISHSLPTHPPSFKPHSRNLVKYSSSGHPAQEVVSHFLSSAQSEPKSEQLVASDGGMLSKQAVQAPIFPPLFPMHRKYSKASSRQAISSASSEDPRRPPPWGCQRWAWCQRDWHRSPWEEDDWNGCHPPPPKIGARERIRDGIHVRDCSVRERWGEREADAIKG